MKKASKILFLIGGIVTILAAIAFLVIGILGFAAGALATAADAPDFVKEIIAEIQKDFPSYTIAQIADLLKTVGAIFIVLFVTAVASVVLSFICASKQYRPLPLLIVAMVFAAAGGSPLSILGGIFGIINWAQERKAQTPAA